jgi:signal transduction histidine kinase
VGRKYKNLVVPSLFFFSRLRRGRSSSPASGHQVGPAATFRSSPRQKNASPSHISRFPMRQLLIGVLLTMAMALFAIGSTWSAYKGFADIAQVELRLDRLSGVIIHLDEVLTMSARMCAATGEHRWEERYRHFEPLLDDAIKETIAIAPEESVRQAAKQTDVANIKLVEMEHASFDLVRDGRQTEAKSLLFSQEYEEQKAVYANAINECKRVVERRVDAQMRHHVRRALFQLGLTLAALMTLGLGWIKVLRLVRQNDAERVMLLSQLENAVQARDQFLSVASHELKTPVTTLKLQTDSLMLEKRRLSTGGDNSRLDRRLGVVTRQVDRLNKLIDELLDTSRITGGAMSLVLEEGVDLTEVIRETSNRFKPELNKASCEVSIRGIEQPILGRWDPMRLDQVLSNLFSNSLKYAPGKPIEITAEADERVARIEFRDHGIGIAPDKHEIVFQRFERAVPERRYGGFGLGLWIVREVVTAMGGEVSLQSQLGEGAAFRVVLPRSGVKTNSDP